ncbi:MAG: hypothetical protein JSW58_02620 [Candidatus Latescibacterota bacterium]|nr:MAG: hypothetical protein JSW58_02620 [Candidatus Latescibacterota bacterium]
MQIILLWVVLILFVTLGIWVITVVPRVKKRKASYVKFMTDPLPVWTPPNQPSEKKVVFPALDDVDWETLSTEVDREGIFVVDYDALGRRGVAGKKRNPADIAAFGIKRAKKYLETSDPHDLLLATRQFRYLEDNARVVEYGDATGVAWCADFDMGYQYQLKAPWKSAYFQTYAMCALLWAHWLSGDERYIGLFRRGLVSLGRTIDEGGLAYKTSEGGLFFEEVVADPPHHILNGHLYSLLNLFRSHELTGSEEAKRIFELGVQGTVDMLPKFDKYGYSLYSLSPRAGLRNHFNIANPFYHHSHVVLLRTLHELSGRRVFRQYAEKWEKRCDGFFDTAWTTIFVMFKDVMKFVKRV